MSFTQAIASCMRQYVGFSGRASRSEYWWFFLFTVVVAVVASLIDPTGVIYLVATLGLFLPSLAVAVRRLHDTGRSGWWLLIGFVPLLGFIVLLAFLVTNGDPTQNRYGPAAGRAEGGVPQYGLSGGDIARRPCPQCGELIALQARICRYCNFDLGAHDAETGTPRIEGVAPAAPIVPLRGSRCGNCGKNLSPYWRVKCQHCGGTFEQYPPV